MKKPMLNAIQKVKMSMAMKSKNPKMNPGFDSLPKEVQNKIMKKKAKLSMKKKPKMAMKKPKMGGMKKTMMAMKTKEPKMAMKKPAMMGMKKPASTKRGNKIKTYNISGFVSKHTGLKPGSYEKAVIMNGVRNAAPSRRKKIMELLKSNAGTADMFKTTKPKMSMKKPMLSKSKKKSMSKELKKGSKESKKVLQGYFGPGKKPKMAMKKKPKMAMKKAKASQTAGAIMKRERMMN